MKKIAIQLLISFLLLITLALQAACACTVPHNPAVTTPAPNPGTVTASTPEPTSSSPAGSPASPTGIPGATTLIPDAEAPAVILLSPLDLAAGVATNSVITATFSEAMDPATLTEATFSLGSVSGKVDYAGVTATFVPSAGLDSNTRYTATITTGARDLAGNALETPVVWSFTTGAAPDTVAPAVSSVNPLNMATGAAINSLITATFSEAPESLTVNTDTFTLTRGTTPVSGTVSCSGATATFTPAAALSYSTTYTATLTTGVKDFSGNALAASYQWSFTTKAGSSGGGGGGSGHTPTPEIRSVTLTDSDLPQAPIEGMTFHFMAPTSGDAEANKTGKLRATYGVIPWSIWFGVTDGQLWVYNLPKKENMPESLRSFYDYLGIDEFTVYTEEDGKYWFTDLPPWLNISQYDPEVVTMPAMKSVSSTDGQATIRYILK